jgi:hypothetical protein
MEGHCSTGQSPQWAVVRMEEEEEEETYKHPNIILYSVRQNNHFII